MRGRVAGRSGRRASQVIRAISFGLVAYLALQLVWPTPAGVVVQGILIGTLTALISFGLALIYRSNRVINFAQADLGVVPAMVAITLLTRTKNVAVPGGVKQVDAGWPYWSCMLIAIVLAVALGLLVERVVIRRFSKAPRLILMVVTIGLAQILAGLGSAIPYFFGDVLPPQTFPSPFDFTFHIHPTVFHGNDLLAVVVSFAAIAALLGFLRYTHVGIAIRASAESADRASLLGVHVARTQSVVWMLAAVLSTAAMILRAGILGLPIGSAFGPVILLRALAAAVIGRMENFTVMYAAACGLGIVETAIIWNKGSSTLVDPALFVIVIAALLLQRRRRESRAEEQAISNWRDTATVRPIPRELAALPEVRWGLRCLAGLLGIAALALPLALGDGHTNLAAAVCIFAIIALSLVVLTGWAGEISLGQVAFVAVGSAVAGGLAVHQRWDLTVTVLIAGLVGAMVSVIIGLPALHIRGLMLAVSTMAFALATSSFLLNRTYFAYLPDNITQRVERFPLLGKADISTETAFYYVCLSALVIALWSVRGLQRSRLFRVLVATRENERAAQAFGVNVTKAKLTAFALSGFLASFAGGLFAFHQRAVGQQIFAPAESIRALTMVVVGGLGSVPGAVLGAIFLKSTEWFNTLVPSQFRFFFTFAGSGAGLILVLWFLPGGLGSVLYRARDSLLRRIAARRGIVVPALLADSGGDGAPPLLDAAAGNHRADGFGDGRRLDDGPSNLLTLRSIDVSYGQVQVLFGVDLDVTSGEIVALLGTNGAGKSTVLRAVSGLIGPKAGTVTFHGADITGMAPHRVAALGLIQVPGGRGVFPSLTVAENLRMAGWMFRHDEQYVVDATAAALALFPVLRDKLHDQAATLSGGQQQMLTLAMAFIAKPKLLMIDELSLGLAPVVVEQLLGAVKQIRARGTTVILVEQSVNVALTVADRAYFMEKGEVRFQGPTAELLARPDILRSVFVAGAAARDPVEAGGVAVGRSRAITNTNGNGNGASTIVLETSKLRKRFSGVTAVDDVSIALRTGEIVGVIGPNGAGKTTLFDLVSGFLAPDAGTIVFGGRDVTALRADRRARLGLAHSFQDARLFGALTVHQAVSVALDGGLDVRDPVAAALNLPEVAEAERRVAARADELIDLMGLGAFRDKFVAELSTGSRRIVDLACQIGMEPRVILFDEPSSGIAQRETEALVPLMFRIREQTGASLLVIEHDMPFITAIADRMVALDLGRVLIEGDAATVLNHPEVIESYLGSSRDAIDRSGSVSGERSSIGASAVSASGATR